MRHSIIQFISKISTSTFLLLICFPQAVKQATIIEKLIVWNVGQGQWLTFVSSAQGRCLHYDFGGEYAPDIKTLQHYCRDKENQVLLSHADWDHRSFFKRLSQLPRLCIFPQSLPELRKTKNQFWIQLSQLPACASQSGTPTILLPEKLLPHQKLKNSNQLSRILFLKGVLATGDAPQKVEDRLVSQVDLRPLRLLILGHHGSKTSTSPRLLNVLPNLKMAVASARYQRYKHPHSSVVARLQKNKTPLLRTEQWGHLHFELQKH